MYIKNVAFSLLLMTGGVVMNAASGAAPPEINVKYTGNLVAEPCIIEPGQEYIVLDFANIIDKYLYINTRTLSKPFEIRLAECDLSIGKVVSVTFRGTESEALPGLLAVDSVSEARGIAIGLETPDSKPLAINTESDKYTLQSGNNLISLKAYIQGEPAAIANKTITRGPFSAIATFSLEYK
ncbi:fimbrial protein [Enterobacter ludwigii]|jgi:type 1 fimbria pilin|nr:fimbrial protein [Enterobacter asburiae]